MKWLKSGEVLQSLAACRGRVLFSVSVRGTEQQECSPAAHSSWWHFTLTPGAIHCFGLWWRNCSDRVTVAQLWLSCRVFDCEMCLGQRRQRPGRSSLLGSWFGQTRWSFSFSLLVWRENTAFSVDESMIQLAKIFISEHARHSDSEEICRALFGPEDKLQTWKQEALLLSLQCGHL